MDLRKIKKLMELLEESGISEIEVKEGEESIKLSRNLHYQQPIASNQSAVRAQEPLTKEITQKLHLQKNHYPKGMPYNHQWLVLFIELHHQIPMLLWRKDKRSIKVIQYVF